MVKKITKEDVFGTKYLVQMESITFQTRNKYHSIINDIKLSKFEKKIMIKQLEKDTRDKILEAIELI
jgi:hypothetical protein